MTLTQQQSPSISYETPPLVEVAMAVQFEPPKGLGQAHLGAFWASRKQEFPHVRAVQPISTANESFGGERQWLPPSLQLALTNEPDSRLQMTSADDQWMLQVQRNRLVINWRKRSNEYPRFETAWDSFKNSWKDWVTFISDLNLTPLIPQLWELTYVNRVPRGPLWNEPADWPNVFPGLWGEKLAVVDDAQLCGFHGQWVWEHSSLPARLYVEPRPVRLPGPPSQEVLSLSFTARGIVSPEAKDDAVGTNCSEIERIEAGIRCGHNFIVSTFDKIASAAAKNAWKRHDHID
jgi:uncharacterized protein (TIGR04255 family)